MAELTLTTFDWVPGMPRLGWSTSTNIQRPLLADPRPWSGRLMPKPYGGGRSWIRALSVPIDSNCSAESNAVPRETRRLRPKMRSRPSACDPV
jgi:hypothetical protein